MPWVHPEAAFLPHPRFSWEWGYLDPSVWSSRGERTEPLNPQHPPGWSGVLDKSAPNCFRPPRESLFGHCKDNTDKSALFRSCNLGNKSWEVLPALRSFVTPTRNGHMRVPVPWGQAGTSPSRAAEWAMKHFVKNIYFMKIKTSIKNIYLYTTYYRFIMYIISILGINNLYRISIFSALIALYLYIFYHVCLPFFLFLYQICVNFWPLWCQYTLCWVPPVPQALREGTAWGGSSNWAGQSLLLCFSSV